MTSADGLVNLDGQPVTDAKPEKWEPRGVQWWLERASERLNPILVKEARQALKSRQFAVTFSLLLLFAWGWSLLGVALSMPELYYTSGGRYMLIGYFLVLAVPLLIVIPYWAFRSLAGEREDGTFELLMITDLSARQIITGKLGSAMLQMLVYYSALSPCIAFTYLLRGVDIVTIFLVLGYTFLASLMLAVFGLVCATATRSRNWQVMMGVLLILALALFALIWTYAMVMMLVTSPPTDRWTFWVSTLAVLTFYFGFVIMGILASASQISFASGNHSTRLRVFMLMHNMLWIGWMTYAWVSFVRDSVFLLGILFPAAVYWGAMGAMMIGESDQISPRARRTLPVSFLGRMARTWLNPGTATGYVFAVLSFTAVVVMMWVLAVAGEMNGIFARNEGLTWWITGGLLTIAYLAFYLGLGRLVVLWLRRMHLRVHVVASLLLTLLIAIAGALVPYFAALWANGFHEPEYTALQAPNWSWTLETWADGGAGLSSWGMPEFQLSALVVVLAGLVMFVVHLVLAYRDVEQVRKTPPQRVLEDDRDLHPPKESARAEPSSPWDD